MLMFIHSLIAYFKMCMLKLGSKLSDSLYKYPSLVWDLAITVNKPIHCAKSFVGYQYDYRKLENNSRAVLNRLNKDIQKNKYFLCRNYAKETTFTLVF